jgi:hypothetical protein
VIARLVSLLLSLVCLAPAVAEAAKPPRFHYDGGAAAKWAISVAADARYAAWALPDGDVRVVDSLTGGARTMSTPAGCEFANVGGGKLLWSCTDAVDAARADAVVLDLATGISTTLHDPRPAYESPPSLRWSAIGTNWIEASASGYHWTGVPWRLQLGAPNWSRGGGSDLRWNQSADLDATDYAVPMCTPLMRLSDGSDGDVFGDGYFDYLYERPYGLQTDAYGGRVKLQRCRSHDTLLAREALSYDLRRGLVAWSDAGAVYLYNPQTRHRTRWPVGALRKGATDPRVALTDRRVFVTVTIGGDRRVYSAARPR